MSEVLCFSFIIQCALCQCVSTFDGLMFMHAFMLQEIAAKQTTFEDHNSAMEDHGAFTTNPFNKAAYVSMSRGHCDFKNKITNV